MGKHSASVHVRAARLMRQGKTREQAYEEAARTQKEGGKMREGRHHKLAQKEKSEPQSFSSAVLGEDEE